jgi:DNA-binding NtrC family response regulator
MSFTTQPVRRVLIIDDEPEIRELLSEFLRQGANVEVLTAANGADALKIIERDRPMAILSDVHMPEMDGVQLQVELKRRSLDIPVVLMTGQGTAEIVTAALRLGAFDYFEKPFDLKAVQQVVISALEVGVHRDRLSQPYEQPASDIKRSRRAIQLLQLSNHLHRRRSVA